MNKTVAGSNARSVQESDHSAAKRRKSEKAESPAEAEVKPSCDRNDDESVWPFAEQMAFLPLDSLSSSESQSNEDEESNDSFMHSERQYKIDADRESTLRLAASVKKLVDLINDESRSRLVYYSMFANLDRMLQKLPEVVAEELNMKFIRMTYEAIKENSK